MHSKLADVSLSTIKARIAEGDFPTIKPYSIEILEELVVHFAERALPASKEAEAVAAAFVDRRGELTVPDGSPLAEMLKALPNAPFGEEVLPLFIAHPPTDAGVSEAMIERALIAYYGGPAIHLRADMKRALEAARSTAIPAGDGVPPGMVLVTVVNCTCHDEASKRLCLKKDRCTVSEAHALSTASTSGKG